MSFKRPNFFIIGAQKSGTTALCEYLCTHPNICISRLKEPHYFSDEFNGIYSIDTLEKYLGLFDHCRKNIAVIGEASTGYLQSQMAVENIYDYNPDSRIIVMLRNPLDLVVSLHSHLVFHGHEDEYRFDKAWKLQEPRKHGFCLPRDPRFYYTLQYANVMRIGSQLKRVFSIFPKSQVEVIIFDDFIKKPSDIYNQALSFLGVSSDNRTEFPKVNPARSLRFISLICLARRVMPWKLRKVFKDSIGRKLVRLLMVRKALPLVLSADVESEMLQIAKEEVEILSDLLNRDFGRWLNCPRV